MRGFGCCYVAVGTVTATLRGACGRTRSSNSTADLVAYCDTEGPVGEVRDGQNFCDGFIAGSGLLYFELVRAGEDQARSPAPSPIPTLAQAREAFVAWATANPDHMQAKPIDGFWRAMADTYPCPE